MMLHSSGAPQVTCPVVLYWGQNDWLTQPRYGWLVITSADPTRDVAEIARQLPGLVASVRVTSRNRLGFNRKKAHFCFPN